MWGIQLRGAQDGYSDAVTQGRTPPLSSHGSCKPIDESPTAPTGNATGVIRLALRSQGGHWSCCHLLAHPIHGVHIAKSWQP